MARHRKRQPKLRKQKTRAKNASQTKATWRPRAWAFAIFMVGLGVVAAAVGWNLRPKLSPLVISTTPVQVPKIPPLALSLPSPPPHVIETPRVREEVEPLLEAALPPLPEGRSSGGESVLPPWRRYAINVPAQDGRPLIALVIDDMGVDRRRSARVVALSGRLTLSYLPYAPDVTSQVMTARASGHEIMVHLPMEATDRNADPGPNALRVGLDPVEQMRRLRWNLDQFSGYVGVNNHMGSRATTDAATMTPILRELKARGLLFLDSKTSSDSVAGRLAKNIDMPSVNRDVFLDHTETIEAVASQLRLLEEVARKQGAAVAIGHPHDITLDQLEQWLPTLTGKGFNLVPLSTIVKRAHPTG